MREFSFSSGINVTSIRINPLMQQQNLIFAFSTQDGKIFIVLSQENHPVFYYKGNNRAIKHLHWDNNPSLLLFSDESEKHSVSLLNLNYQSQFEMQHLQTIRKNMKIEIPFEGFLNAEEQDELLVVGKNELRILLKQDI